MSDETVTTQSRIRIIRAATWEHRASSDKHVFLAGDLQIPVAHPFLRRTDVEVVMCVYEAGDNGLPHWHEETDEIEVILSGQVGYREISTGMVHRFGPGDLLNIPRGVCMERIVAEPARTLAIKLPSRREKVHCRQCQRTCGDRRELFQIV